jgi:lactoylglutathione lyase
VEENPIDVTKLAPRCDLLVIRSPDMERAVKFYQSLGLVFTRHRHGTGPEHYSAERDGFVFEIYPRPEGAESTCGIRFGFLVDDVDSIIPLLIDSGGTLVAKPTKSEWGYRAVLKDLDGNTVELKRASG